jgi:alkylation response protein AidB-like acyl-CoA dehydrogenase
VRSPGVTWRPLVQLSGRREFNELFLEEVRVPAENVLGPVNGGWPLIRAALAHERGTLWAFDFKVRLQNGSRALADLYRRARDGEHGRGADVTTLRDRVAQAWIEAEVFAAHTLRILPKLHAAASGPPEAALQKLFGSEIQQRTVEVAMALAGAYAQLGRDPRALDAGAWAEAYLYARSVTISSGTSEVLRTLIAQQALGLPRG